MNSTDIKFVCSIFRAENVIKKHSPLRLLLLRRRIHGCKNLCFSFSQKIVYGKWGRHLWIGLRTLLCRKMWMNKASPFFLWMRLTLKATTISRLKFFPTRRTKAPFDTQRTESLYPKYGAGGEAFTSELIENFWMEIISFFSDSQRDRSCMLWFKLEAAWAIEKWYSLMLIN